MSNLPPSADAQGYLENLMRVGQDAMKQFDSALTRIFASQRRR